MRDQEHNKNKQRPGKSEEKQGPARHAEGHRGSQSESREEPFRNEPFQSHEKQGREGHENRRDRNEGHKR